MTSTPNGAGPALKGPSTPGHEPGGEPPTGLVIIVGPTASGKSSVAMEVARRVRRRSGRGIQIVSADAMQVYRGLDIGTAKPTAEEQAEVRHWCIDLVEPDARFTVSDYVSHFRTAISAIRAAGDVPLVVGGTGLYISAVVDNLEIPGEWPELRRHFEAIGDADALRSLLAQVDGVSAERIEPNNVRRLVRALEVSTGSGRPFSSFGPGLGAYPPTEHRIFGLRWERDALRLRVVERVHAMLETGLVDEVRGLSAKSLSDAPTARQAIGYKEILEHLIDGKPLDEAVRAVIVRTQQLAVAQDKWFRRDPRITWIDVTHDPVAEATGTILGALP